MSTAATSSRHISLPTILTEGDPTEWLKHYEICCGANVWNNEMEGKKEIFNAIRLVTWLELTTKQPASYYKQKKQKNILERMGPVQFVLMITEMVAS